HGGPDQAGLPGRRPRCGQLHCCGGRRVAGVVRAAGGRLRRTKGERRLSVSTARTWSGERSAIRLLFFREEGSSMTALLETHTYRPADQAELSQVEGVLSSGDESEFALVGPEGTVTIPEEVHRLLVQVIAAMQAGRAVTLTPQTRRLTTQQAADRWGGMRQTRLQAIEAGV